MKKYRVTYVSHSYGNEDKQWVYVTESSVENVKRFFHRGIIVSIEETTDKEE